MTLANKITPHNAGWRSQFRFAGSLFLSGHVCVLVLAKTVMTEEQAIAVAEEYVQQKGSRLYPEVRVWRRKRFLRRTHFWQVVSGYPIKGETGLSRLKIPVERYSRQSSTRSEAPANKRIELMTSIACTPHSISSALGALLVMAHPQR